MIERFFRAFQHSREHWVFWPFFLLIVQIAMYNFLLSENGYLAYLEKSREKQALEKQIQELTIKKKDLEKKLAHVTKDESAIKEFIRRLYYYDDKYTIVKFIDEQDNKSKNKDETLHLVFIQRAYILISTFVLTIFTWFFWKRHKISPQ